MEAAAEVLSELDVLVHNAGVAYPGRVAESIPEQWRASFEVNVTGPVGLTLALLPALRAARGQVVFINSGSGLTVSAGLASYSASKFALRGFSEALRREHEGTMEATVVSALPLADGQLQSLVATLEKKYGRKITAKVELDPKLIGGLKIVVGDKVIDATVRGKLDAMAAALTH